MFTKLDILIKLYFFYNIWKEIDQLLLPYRLCSRNIFSFPKNMLFIFARCELLSHLCTKVVCFHHITCNKVIYLTKTLGVLVSKM